MPDQPIEERIREALEEWREAPGYPNYQVSNFGAVRSRRRSGSRGDRVGISRSGKGGYSRVSISNEEGRRTVSVHSLVAAAFHGPRPDGSQIRHLNGNHGDNRAANLAYGSQSENEQDKILHGTHHHASKERCIRGHELAGSNVYNPPGTTWRRCRACRRMHRPGYRAINPYRGKGA